MRLKNIILKLILLIKFINMIMVNMIFCLIFFYLIIDKIQLSNIIEIQSVIIIFITNFGSEFIFVTPGALIRWILLNLRAVKSLHE